MTTLPIPAGEDGIAYDHTIDKSDWGAGPWQDEPDKVVWIDHSTGLDAMAVRNHMGAWCGYVGLPPGHPWHGLDYDEIDASAHGGLTYAAKCHGPVCHEPAAGRPHDVWWVGFDLNHGHDLAPGTASLTRERYESRGEEVPSCFDRMPDEHYRTLGYVRAEVARLAGQAGEAR